MNVFDRLKKNSGIFLDEGKLASDYVPDDILYRENEIKEIAFCLQGIVNGKRGEHAIVTGPPGTGKTTCARHVISQMREHSKKAIPIYVNCWEFSSKFSVLSEIANKLGEILPRRGIALDEIMDRVIQRARSEKAGIDVFLDQADRLILEGEEGIFYDFARSPEMHGVNFSIIAIANRKELFSEMDARIKSSLSAKSIEFLQYAPEQLRGILKGRARVAFVPGVLDDEVISMCAGIGAKRGGDARIGISVLLGAGKEAETEGAKKVSVEHVQKAKERIYGDLKIAGRIAGKRPKAQKK